MADLPIADIHVDIAVASAAIAQQFPSLASRPVTWLGEGWDNVVFSVGADIIFRFPRRTIALAGIRYECAVLPRLAPQLPQRIPNGRFAGAPSEIFPHPFMGYDTIVGTELLLEERASPTARSHLAKQLGEFLRTLHSTPVLHAFAADLPRDVRGVLTAAGLTSRALAYMQSMRHPEVPALCAAMATIPGVDTTTPLPAHDCIVHGDLHLRHVLTHPTTGSISGIIDWGDMHVGHPAIDLSLYWSALTPQERPEFLHAYGPFPAPWRHFARAMALFSCAALAAHAEHEARTQAADAALRGIVCALA